MNIINVSVAELIEQQQPEYCVVPIGNQGEHGVTRILFDCTQFISLYGEGIAQLLHQRNGDGIPYIVTVSQEENVIRWDISGDDTARDGFGKLQLNWYVSGNLAKSCVLRTMVKKALTDATLIPEEVKSDLELLTEAVASKNPRLNAGTNVTITDNTDGTQTISASGGSVDVEQTTGQSTTAVMSQKAVTDELDGKQDNLTLGTGLIFHPDGELRLDYDILQTYIDEHQEERLAIPITANRGNRPMSSSYLASVFEELRQALNTGFASKANVATTYTKTEVDNALSDKQNILTAGDGISVANDTIIVKKDSTLKFDNSGNLAIDFTGYNIATGVFNNIDKALNGAHGNIILTKLEDKADVSTTYTKTEVDALISAAIADVSALIGGASS